MCRSMGDKIGLRSLWDSHRQYQLQLYRRMVERSSLQSTICALRDRGMWEHHLTLTQVLAGLELELGQ